MALVPQKPLFAPSAKKVVDKLNVTLGRKGESICLGREGQDLEIDFERTLRVPDNNQASDLPPSFGSFKLLEVKDYTDKLPGHMAAKGEFFFPMYQREAMWINLSSTKPFAIKIYVGGINAVSGEPAIETEATIMRRAKRIRGNECVQDYVVTPQQQWLDGVASGDGTVRQFVAVATGSGYSVEAQITGHDHIAGLQFEVTPSHKLASQGAAGPGKFGQFEVIVKTLTGKSMGFWCDTDTTCEELKHLIQDSEGIPPYQQRLVFAGKKMEGIDHGSILHLTFRSTGGGCIPEMAIGAGGKIRQTIRPDTSSRSRWDIGSTTTFNVQILNSATYQAVTGSAAPKSPIKYASYVENGYPFYAFYKEYPTGIHGDFEGVKSVNQLDATGTQTEEKKLATGEVMDSLHSPVVLLDLNGRCRGFRHVDDIKAEVESMRRFFSNL